MLMKITVIVDKTLVPCIFQTRRIEIKDDPRGYTYWFDPCRGYSQCPDQIDPAGADTAVSILI